jgi:hypothetical protein
MAKEFVHQLILTLLIFTRAQSSDPLVFQILRHRKVHDSITLALCFDEISDLFERQTFTIIEVRKTIEPFETITASSDCHFWIPTAIFVGGVVIEERIVQIFEAVVMHPLDGWQRTVGIARTIESDFLLLALTVSHHLENAQAAVALGAIHRSGTKSASALLVFARAERFNPRRLQVSRQTEVELLFG